MVVVQEGLSVALPSGASLHVQHCYVEGQVSRPAVLMLHGAIENGRIFYTDSGKGLGPYLAQLGYDVYIADFQGRGQSRPVIDAQARHGQSSLISEDLPTLMDWLWARQQSQAFYVIGHSWSGVLLNALLGREPQRREQLRACVYFGTKRRIRVWNWHRLLYIDFGWRLLFPWLIRRHGYLPALRYKVGADNETANYHRECDDWIRQDEWIDHADGFDYRAALQAAVLPPTLYFAGQRDRCLGHPKDVQRLINESGVGVRQYHLLAKSNGHYHDYDHINMLTHRDAAKDHFPQVDQWLQQHYEVSHV